MPLPARLYQIPRYASQAIPYTMPYPPGHTICPSGHTKYYAMPPVHIIKNAMPVRPYHIPWHACQAIPYILPCPPGHIIYHAMPSKPYHIMPARPYHIPCHVGSQLGRPSITLLIAEIVRVRNVSLPGQ